MRGGDERSGSLFSYVDLEARVPPNHPLRKIRALVRDVLGELNRSFARLYSSEGRPSIAPEQLLSALLLQVLYGIRSERQLMEQLDYSLLYRWFVGLSPDDPVWNPTSFTKNRERLQTGDVFTKFMTRLLNSQVEPLLSDEHFSVDGTLIEAWASFRPKDGSDGHDGKNFHGQTRKSDTHVSTSDPDSQLYRKAAGREIRLCYMGHVSIENRHGLAVAGIVTHASRTAERRAAEIMLEAEGRKAGRRITAGADKAYDTADHATNLRAIERHTACDTEQWHGQDRPAPPERYRRTDHAPSGLWHVADAPGDRMHLRLEQVARTMRRTKHRGCDWSSARRRADGRGLWQQ